MKRKFVVGTFVLGILGSIVLNCSVPAQPTAKKDCFICGSENKSLMPYYAQFDTLGIVNLLTLDVTDTRVRKIEDRRGQNSSTSTSVQNNYGEGKGSVQINGIPGRGISNIEISYGDEKLDNVYLQRILCINCMRDVLDEGEGYGKPICLVDFVTREVFPINGTYIKNDYYIHVDSDESENVDSLSIVYAPESKE